jgi:DNA-binding XRE family transcriptional regulator
MPDTVVTENLPRKGETGTKRPRSPHGKLFEALRKTKGFSSQNSLAIAIGSSPTLIGDIERDDYVPGYAVRKRICKALGVTMERIWPGVDDD